MTNLKRLIPDLDVTILRFPELIWHKNKDMGRDAEENMGSKHPFLSKNQKEIMALNNVTAIHFPMVQAREWIGIRTLWLEGENYEDARMMYFDEMIESRYYPEIVEQYKKGEELFEKYSFDASCFCFLYAEKTETTMEGFQ